MEVFTVTFFGHRDFGAHRRCEKQLEKMVRELIEGKEYVEFLVGRNGEFDIFVSSVIKRAQRELWGDNSSLVLALPYMTAQYRNSEEYFNDFYDEIEVCDDSYEAHFKAKIQIRNRNMVDRADLVVCYIDRAKGGAYQTMRYAIKQGKRIINVAEKEDI